MQTEYGSLLRKSLYSVQIRENLDTFHAVVYRRIKETIKKYFLVRMKEACGDALSLEPILS